MAMIVVTITVDDSGSSWDSGGYDYSYDSGDIDYGSYDYGYDWGGDW